MVAKADGDEVADKEESGANGKAATTGFKRSVVIEIEINIYFTASSPPLGGPTPEIDPYERQTHNWREPKALRLEKEKKMSILRVLSCEGVFNVLVCLEPYDQLNRRRRLLIDSVA